MQSTSDAELAAKTAEWQQAMDIGQDLLEKNRALQDELGDTQHTAEQLKAQLEPMESEIAQLKDIIRDHEENSLLIEEERQGMEEQRYRITELEGLRDMLEQELRDKDDHFEVRLQDELDQQKDMLEQKFQSELEWEQKKTENALQEAAAAAQDSQQQEASDVEKLKAQIVELQGQVDTVTRSLAMEQSFASAFTRCTMYIVPAHATRCITCSILFSIMSATEPVSGAHKNEIKKGQVALAEAKKERKDTLEKIKARDAQVKKLEASKEDSDRLVQAKTQEVLAVWTFLVGVFSTWLRCARDLEV
jgi:chromosome segregation ATPase